MRDVAVSGPLYCDMSRVGLRNCDIGDMCNTGLARGRSLSRRKKECEVR